MKSRSQLPKVFVGSLVLPIALALMGGIHLAGLAWAQPIQPITLISGNGPIGSQDPANQFTLDGGVTWQDAFIIAPHPAYHVIPGTQYINRNPDFSGPEFTSTRYRTIFVLPSGFSSPSLTVQIHADNVATLFLNGVQIGQQPFAEIFENFQDPPESFTAINPSLFRVGVNILEFDIFNFSGPTAFDYKAIVSFTPVVVNDLVTFEPIESTFAFTPDPTGCPEGFMGRFSFEATLSNTGDTPLASLSVHVTTLTNGNLLENADGGPGGVGAQLTVPQQDGFTDGVLSPDEFVDVPFIICLTQRQPFTFVVDVIGVADTSADAQANAPLAR